MIPNELENRDEIIAMHGVHFRNATSVMHFAFRLSAALQKVKAFDRFTLSILVGILVREARKQRAVTLLCEHGFMGEAEQLARSIFDGLLATRFVTRDPVTDSERPQGIQPPRYPLIPKDVNPIVFRSRVYISHVFIQKSLQLNTDWVRQNIPIEVIQHIQDREAEIRRDIGPEWIARVGKVKGYSGLGIKDLAGNYGLLEQFNTVYKELSNRTHANDAFAAMDILKGHTEVYICGKQDGIENVLRLASGFLAAICDDIARAVGLPKFCDEACDMVKAISRITS